MLIVRNFSLLLQIRALAQVDYSNVVSSEVNNRLNLMAAMRPGFLRAGRQPGILCLKTSGMEWPAVSVSSPGGTAGTPTELCKSASII
jgi:hypothetical protein